VLQGDSVHLTFSRSFGTSQEREWGELLLAIAGVPLSERGDVICWELGKKGIFSSKTMYEFILNPGVRDLRMLDMWGVDCPLKQKNFLWLCFRGQIQSAVQLITKNWHGSSLCVSCGKIEDVEHILFICPVARLVWSVICVCFNKNVLPRSRDEFVDLFLGAGGNKQSFSLDLVRGSCLGTVAY
jgi:hypothetical protein